MAFYRTGTVSVTNGQKLVTGTGTGWLDAGMQKGWPFQIGANRYEIEDIISNTQLNLRTNAVAGASNAAYWIEPLPTDEAGAALVLYAAVRQLIDAMKQIVSVSTENVKEILLSTTTVAGIKRIRWHSPQKGGNGDIADFGNDVDGNVALRVFPNGSTATTAMSVANATGVVAFPQGISVTLTQANMPSYVGSSPPFPSNDLFDITVPSGAYFVNQSPANSPVTGMSGFVEIMRSGANLAQVNFWSRDALRQQWSISQGGGTWGAWKLLSATGPNLDVSGSGTFTGSNGTGVTVSNGTSTGSFLRTSNTEFRIDATSPTSGNMMFNPISNDGSGNMAVGFGRYTSNSGTFQLLGYLANGTSSTAWRISSNSGLTTVFGGAGENVGIGVFGATEKLTVSGNIAPATDNSNTCGTSARRWSVVYAATGTINTSDIRVKFNIEKSKLGLDFINELNPTSYQRKDGETLVEYVDVQVGEEEEVVREWDEVIGEDEDGTPITEKRQETRMVPTWGREERPCGVREGRRIHYGFIAQEVKAALDKHGAGNCAMHTLADPTDPESQQGLRPDQLLAPMVKAIQELSAKLDAQAAEIAALQAR